MASESALDTGQLFVPREEDDERVRYYVRWVGGCPCKDKCTKQSWAKVNPKLWSSKGIEELMTIVEDHLVLSTNHNLSRKQAVDVVQAFFDAEPDFTIEHECETYEDREKHRKWYEDEESKKQTAQERNRSAGSSQATTMVAEAVPEMCRPDGHVKTQDVVEAVAVLTGAGAANAGPVMPALPPRVAGPLLPMLPPTTNKKRKIMIAFDLDEVKTLPHVLSNAKSAANVMAKTADCMTNTFRQSADLMEQCHADLRGAVITASQRYQNAAAAASTPAASSPSSSATPRGVPIGAATTSRHPTRK